MHELTKLEIYTYFMIWTTGVGISLYRLFLVGQVFDHTYHDQYHYEDFKNGWWLFGGRFQDQADYEWNTWTALFKKLTPFLLINLVVSEFIRFKKFFDGLPLWHSLITVCFLIVHFNLILTIWFVCQIIVYFVIIHYSTQFLTWVVSFIIIHFLKPDIWFVENEDDQYLIMVSSSWLVLRCISYSIEKFNSQHLKKKKSTLLDLLFLFGYAFYLPTMFCGPFISYSCFKKGKSKEFKWTQKRILVIIKSFSKCLFWYIFTIIALHFIYVNAILLRPNFVKHLSNWELAGLGIAMGHFFHLKYLVFYGIPCAWASAEGFDTPPLPCCVSTVHLYSYMWRYFDHGLYQFLVSYIYIPIISQIRGKLIVRKLIASIACFVFMFTWHKEQDYVFFWVLFNFIAIALELVVKNICKISNVQRFIERNFSPQNQVRFQCVLAAPLHCFSMVSNYFFIGNGVDIGFLYMKRIYYGSYTCKLTILFFLYGAGQTAVAVQKWVDRSGSKYLKKNI